MTRREHAGTTVFNTDTTPFDQLPLVTYDPADQTLAVTRGEFGILTLTSDELTQLADGPGEPYAVFTNRRGERRLIRDGARVPLDADHTLHAEFPHDHRHPGPRRRPEGSAEQHCVTRPPRAPSSLGRASDHARL